MKMIMSAAVAAVILAASAFGTPALASIEASVSSYVSKQIPRLKLTPEQKAPLMNLIRATAQRRAALFQKYGLKRGQTPGNVATAGLVSEMTVLTYRDGAEAAKILTPTQYRTYSAIRQEVRALIYRLVQN